MLIERCTQRHGGPEVVKQPQPCIKTSLFVQEQVYLIFIYSCIREQDEKCLVERGYCVCVYFLNSEDFLMASLSRRNVDDLNSCWKNY